MATTYILHKRTGAIGVADIPEWVSWEENPPRTFDVRWGSPMSLMGTGSTDKCVPITKEVADIMRSLNDA